MNMTLFKTRLRTMLASTMLLSTLLVSGCAGARVAVGYRVYDPYRRDYHTWDGNEGGLYTQWTLETHREGQRDFKKLDQRDQEEYWRWRHDRH